MKETRVYCAKRQKLETVKLARHKGIKAKKKVVPVMLFAYITHTQRDEYGILA